MDTTSGGAIRYLARPGQALAAHLRGVAERAARFAVEASGGAELESAARAGGLLHDLGKYRAEFQEYIRGHRAKGEATWHKQAGAAKAADARRWDISLAIAGHHGGLPDIEGWKTLVAGPGGRDVATTVWANAVADCPELGAPIGALRSTDKPALELWTRLLFSCLVDADWLDSSAAERSAAGRAPLTFCTDLGAEGRLTDVLSYVAARSAQCKDERVRACRADVLQAAVAAAQNVPGLFSMTVPTGGGKTLSALAFALSHAAQHGLRRVIYVAPYLSIIEQNAAVIREAMGGERLPAGFVLEQHSLSEPEAIPGQEEFTDARARLAENWDAPVVVTTNVQFFESLFASKPGRCRKIHNIARSVVILDECQTLPPELVAPTCRMLEDFARLTACTVVLCTATQPAWERSDALPEGLTSVREIVPASLRLFERLRRVRVTWPREPGAKEEAWNWPRVAARMTEGKARSLCIVNTRSAAREAFAALRQLWLVSEDTFHLSTYMCPQHRRRIVRECVARLRDGRPCLLVSTQCIEAGVDIDFPLVLRELGPLESIVQAAGRCNREGLLIGPDRGPGGQVVVFESEGRRMPPGWYRLGRDKVAEALTAGSVPDIDDPESMRAYFRRLYRSGDTDQHGIDGLRNSLNFPEVATKYRLITDDSMSVVVRGWSAEQRTIDTLLAVLRADRSLAAFRALAPYQVNLRASEIAVLGGALDDRTISGVTICDAPYDEDLGLMIGGAPGPLVV
jgi:CRISPR-associated endonuclease/helicase Cas3